MLVKDTILINNNICLKKKVSTNTINAGIYFPVGSFNDSVPGIAHLIEHLIFEKLQEINHKRIIAIINAYTTREYTMYSLICHKKYFEQCLTNFLNIIFNMKFESEKIQHQKSIVIKEMELSSKENEIQSYIVNNFFKNVSSNPICGTESSIANITLHDITKHYESFYFKQGFVLSINGGLNLSKGKFFLENLLNNIKETKRVNINLDNNISLYDKSKISFKGINNKFIKLNQKGDYYRRVWIMPSLSNVKEKILFSLLITLLSGGIGSDFYNLFQKDSAYSYFIRPYHFTIKNNTFFVIEIQNTNNNYYVYKDIVSNIISNRVAKGISKHELDNMKYLYQLLLEKNHENSFYLMEEAGKSLLYNISIEKNELEVLNSININDFNDFIVKSFGNKDYIEFI